ncbi:CHAT domain-containing protein [Microlunatus antarcticus]|uniref:Tetratricopeptide (TPR) repeat protein n=1 Tax=Microlunatus antarcticus TaxID=53388 RepID=A0A7W5P648_9ACTN|nr:tetratricopeptide (TPR) repeat protein [Microlunatus antarcticus]
MRLLVLLSNMEYEVGGPARSRAPLAAASDLAVAVRADDLAFVIHQTLGLQSLRSGAFDEALTHFTAAEPLLRSATDLDAVKMLLNRGVVNLERLDLVAARRDFARCLDRAAGHPELLTLAMMATHNLGWVEHLSGHQPAALQRMSDAADLGGGAAPAVALLDRARVLIEAGLTDDADATLREAAEQFRQGRAWASLAETELSGAQVALLTGRFDLARRLAGSARTRFRRRGNVSWRRRAELVLLAGDLSAGRPPGLLAAPALRLADEFAADELTTYAKSARLLGCEALLAAGRRSEAAAVFATIAPPRRTDIVELRLQQRTVAAQLARAAGDAALAARQVRRGLDELVRHQAQFGSVDLQTASALHGRRLAALDLDLALERGRPADVFAALERGRAQSRRLVPVTPPADASASSLVELRRLTATLHEIGADPGRRAEAQDVRERISEVEDRLRGLAWRSAGLGPAHAGAALARVRERLAQRGRQLVVLGRHRGDLVAVVLGAGRPRLVGLPGAARAGALARTVRADLDVVARSRVPERLRTSATASATHKLAALERLLLEPLGLSDAPLVVVPTADLSTLPWSCLPSLVGRPVEVAPTAGAWWQRAGSGGGQADDVLPARVVALAGPGVPAAVDEVARVAATWPGTRVFTGPAATGQAFAEQGSTATIAHLAAHGHHVAQNPLFSSLDLADGPLFAYELDAAQVPAHVVLSACELGQATVRPGEESLGLTSVLLQLGARCVVAGVAEVGDELAAEVMVGYHRRLAGGADTAVALADAIAATGRPVPFVCFGAAVRFAAPA